MERSWTVAGVVLAGAGVVLAAGLSDASMGQLAGLGVLALLAGAIAALGHRRATSEVVPVALEELELRITEAAHERSQMQSRAQTAGRFREEFVAAVRHELKTPLNAILGFTQVLLDDLDGPLTPQQHEDVTAIRQAGLYLSELVEAVLEEWAPARDAPLSLAPMDLEHILRDVARLLEGQTTGKDVTVRVEIAPDVPRPHGDARRIRQVMINLGTNGLRATARGSVTLAAKADPEGVRITVRDTGTGIAPDVLPRLFEEFAQSASSRPGGTGLGLALSRDLVEWHGGRIEVETQPNQGTAFHVILPMEPE
jgi:signal transduction histidine kinase